MLARRVVLLAGLAVWAPLAQGADLNQAMLDALRPVHGFVGEWTGSGQSQKSSGWKEAISATYGFRDRDGRVGIYLTISHNRQGIMNKAALLFDPSSGKYGVLAEMFNGSTTQQMLFLGDLIAENTLRLEQHVAGQTQTPLRLDLKLTRGGDKLTYTLSGRVGSSSVFKQIAEVEFFRDGDPLENFKQGPFCAVTGGAGRIEVMHNGKAYHVADTRTRDEFLKNPDKYAK